jgi:hypothetical protein
MLTTRMTVKRPNGHEFSEEQLDLPPLAQQSSTSEG